jgi:NAD(P)-dependent dehydrogenase (short-subunit alcohol dehydrogenase family)
LENSIVAFKPFAMLSHYSASKWAVRGFTQAFAMEMAEHKITVNGYAPGIVGTAMWDLIDEELGKKKGVQKGETINKYVTELTALGRVSVPEGKPHSIPICYPFDESWVSGACFKCIQDLDHCYGKSEISPNLSGYPNIFLMSQTNLLHRCCKNRELLGQSRF